MTVSITVGMAWNVGGDPDGVAYYRAVLAQLSETLAGKGLRWAEPDVTGRPAQFTASGVPSSFLDALRRLYASVRRGEPISESDVDWSSFVDSHLVLCAASSGYYVPVDFPWPQLVMRTVVGSSQQLLTELATCAEQLGVVLDDDGNLPAGEAARLRAIGPGEPLAMQTAAWLHLHDAARASIASGHAIVLH